MHASLDFRYAYKFDFAGLAQAMQSTSSQNQHSLYSNVSTPHCQVSESTTHATYPTHATLGHTPSSSSRPHPLADLSFRPPPRCSQTPKSYWSPAPALTAYQGHYL